jgi:hypothetical protein
MPIGLNAALLGSLPCSADLDAATREKYSEAIHKHYLPPLQDLKDQCHGWSWIPEAAVDNSCVCGVEDSSPKSGSKEVSPDSPAEQMTTQKTSQSRFSSLASPWKRIHHGYQQLTDRASDSVEGESLKERESLLIKLPEPTHIIDHHSADCLALWHKAHENRDFRANLIIQPPSIPPLDLPGSFIHMPFNICSRWLQKYKA